MVLTEKARKFYGVDDLKQNSISVDGISEAGLGNSEYEITEDTENEAGQELTDDTEAVLKEVSEFADPLILQIQATLDSPPHSEMLAVCRAIDDLAGGDQAAALADRVPSVAYEYQLAHCQQELYGIAVWWFGEERGEPR